MSSGVGIISATKTNAKKCFLCGMGFVDNVVVVEYVSSSMRGNYHYRWVHFDCFVLAAKSLISKEYYAKLYDLWLLKQI